jgi:pullulanase
MGSELLRSKSQDRNTYNAGDWFNYVDFTGQTNNWDVGLPLFSENQSRYELIQQLRANVNSQVAPADIALTADVFRDLLKIRSGSKLFRLNTAAEVRDRIEFYNLGTTRIQGLIVMSIDDGANHDDLDPEADAVVVVFNSGSTDRNYTIGDAAGLGFELHAVQQTSTDTVVQTASFDNDVGSFTVPARTTAVFVKPQSGARVGLPPQ